MKRKLRKTGEAIEVIAFSGGVNRSEYDSISYIDSNGEEHVGVSGLNYYWDTEPAEDMCTRVCEASKSIFMRWAMFMLCWFTMVLAVLYALALYNKYLA